METTKTVIGAEGLSNPTPTWLTWVFRTQFVINKVLLFVLGATSLVTPDQVKEAIIWISAVDLAVWTFGRFVGVKKEDFES